MDADSWELEEYREVGYNLRHYSSLRFATFTLLFAFNAGVAAVSFSSGFAAPIVVLFIAVVPNLALYFFIVRIDKAWFEHFARVLEIEEEHGLGQYRRRDPGGHHAGSRAKLTSSTFWGHVLCLLFMVSWPLYGLWSLAFE